MWWRTWCCLFRFVPGDPWGEVRLFEKLAAEAAALAEKERLEAEEAERLRIEAEEKAERERLEAEEAERLAAEAAA